MLIISSRSIKHRQQLNLCAAHITGVHNERCLEVGLIRLILLDVTNSVEALRNDFIIPQNKIFIRCYPARKPRKLLLAKRCQQE